ncbi:unnamed protein product [Diamesa serratosioi]
MKSFFGVLLVSALIVSVLAGGDPYAFCDLNYDEGNSACDQAMSSERFYYNKVTGACEQFTYNGCGGNQNNFVFPWDCETVCITLGSARP